MKRRLTYGRILGSWLLALGTSMPAAAQEVPRVELSGGYQALFVAGDIDETFGKGWYADVSGNLNGLLGIVFQLSGNYKTFSETLTAGGVTSTSEIDLRAHTFMAGVRLNVRPNPGVTPFAQLLVGAVRGSADVEATLTGGGQTLFASSEGGSITDVALQIGGGLNLRLSDRIGVRAGVDYLRVFEEDGGLNAFRFAIGAVFPF